MAEPIRVLELRSVRGTGGGPEKTILAGAALSDPARYAVTVCYIRDQRDDVFAIDRRASTLSVDYVEVLERHSFDVAVWPALKALVRERRIDIVHAHDYKTNFYAWLLGRAGYAIPLATLHGYTGHSWREVVYYWLDKRVVRRFPLLIAVSSDLRQELIRTGSRPERVVVILNGIDDEVFRRDRAREAAARAALGLASGDIVVGAVGRLEPQKRFDLLMRAFATLRRGTNGDRLRLVIAGDGSLMDSLTEERRALGLDDVVRLVGHHADVAVLHHTFDLFVQSSEYEGTPNAVLEAMALETPIVATDVGGTSELVVDGEHGLIVPPGRPDAIAGAVTRLLDNPNAARKMAGAARRRIENELSFSRRMAAVERIYDRLAGSRQVGAHD